MQCPTSWSATDSKSTLPGGMLVAVLKSTLPSRAPLSLIVFTTFWTGFTIDAALGLFGSMHTVTVCVPPEPV